MHDRLPPKGMFSRSRDLFKFWEISVISRKRCKINTQLQLKTNSKSYVVCRIAPLGVTFSDLEGHVCWLKPLCPSATVVRVHDGARAQ